MKIQAKLAMGISTMAIILLSGCAEPKKEEGTKATRDFCGLLAPKVTTCAVDMDKGCSDKSEAALVEVISCKMKTKGGAEQGDCMKTLTDTLAADVGCLTALMKVMEDNKKAGG